MARLESNLYFMNIARESAKRSTCPEKSVGAVIAKDNFLISTGFNGSITGQPHCEDVGCILKEGKCIRTIHAEVNAVSQAAMRGISVYGSTMYVTTVPCWSCFRLIANSKIARIVVLGEGDFSKIRDRVDVEALAIEIFSMDYEGRLKRIRLERCPENG